MGLLEAIGSIGRSEMRSPWGFEVAHPNHAYLPYSDCSEEKGQLWLKVKAGRGVKRSSQNAR
jgi:hypothetical protein